MSSVQVFRTPGHIINSTPSSDLYLLLNLFSAICTLTLNRILPALKLYFCNLGALVDARLVTLAHGWVLKGQNVQGDRRRPVASDCAP